MVHEQFIVSLLQLPRIGRKSAFKILQHSEGVPSTPAELRELVLATPRTPQVTEEDAKSAWQKAEQILENSASNNIKPLAWTNDRFPSWLKSIPDPPLILFIKGDESCISTPMGIAVIGTRQPTQYGRTVAHRLGQRSAEAGYVVISGLAEGCDSEAHTGCLEAGGKTVAVLAHGIGKNIYPKSNQHLAERILENGGCWVSEYPPDTRAQRSYFVERDRIQSGLSSGVVVIETDTKGGTMHTVKYAEHQQRPLACLAHPQEQLFESKTRGNQFLIQNNRAKPLNESNDFKKFLLLVDNTAALWHQYVPDIDKLSCTKESI
ncbi:DNA-processing protein DprA [Gimesia sp.]|uniref:DNA-processing protein DprA n=1 Tax=Gimesia sp. TaxID=2024833 RepID=UPI003A8EA42E